MVKARDEATWFPTAAAWRAWLEANHDSATELWVGISKKHVEGGLSYTEAVDEALCFGWIDGIAMAWTRTATCSASRPGNGRASGARSISGRWTG